MRLGVFGGSFDPVHYGHLLLAECSREQLELDQVWLTPAAAAPHKLGRPLTPGHHRLAMLELAVAGHEALRVCDLEVRRGGVSYTVQTLEAIRRDQPEAELFLLLGADSLVDLPSWREAARICQLALPAAVGRPGSPPPDDVAPLASLVDPDRLDRIRRSVVRMPLIELSSSDIRRRVAEGRSIRYRTPRAVEQYIAAHGLYRSGG